MASVLKSSITANTSGIVDGQNIDAADVTTPIGELLTNLKKSYVSISSADLYAKYLDDAILAGTGITKTKNNAAADETLTIAVGTLAAVASSVSGSANASTFDSYVGAVLGTTIIARHARGTSGTPTQLLTGDEVGRFEARGYHSGSAFAGNMNGALILLAAQDFTGSAQGTDAYIYTTSNGTTTAQQVVKFSGAGIQTNTYRDSGTNDVVNTFVTYRLAGSAPAANYGTGWEQHADSNGTTNRTMLRLSSWWTTATDASRATRGAIEMLDNGGTRTPITFGANGTASILGFHGTAPVVKPTVTGSRGANAALASLLTALANYGLLTDSSS